MSLASMEGMLKCAAIMSFETTISLCNTTHLLLFPCGLQDNIFQQAQTEQGSHTLFF